MKGTSTGVFEALVGCVCDIVSSVEVRRWFLGVCLRLLVSCSHLAGGGDATTLRTLLHNTNGLELLQDGTGNGPGADRVVEAADATVLGTTVVLAEGTHTHVTRDVQLASHGRRADVKPVGVIGGELLEGGSLHNVNPGGHLHLAL